MNRKKRILYSLALLMGLALTYFYIWEKPRLEKALLQIVETEIRSQVDAVSIDITNLKISLIPIQLELYGVDVEPKKDLKKFIKKFSVKRIVLRPSFVDLIIGRPWASLLEIDGSSIDLQIPETQVSKEKPEPFQFDLNKILPQIPISQIRLKEFKVHAKYGNSWTVTTESLYIRAYNEKSSLVVTIKDPNTKILNLKNKKSLDLLNDFQVMVTQDSISLSSIKVVKGSSFFLASGNLIYEGSPEKYKELNIKTRIKTDLNEIRDVLKIIEKEDELDIFNGDIKADFQFSKARKQVDIATEGQVELKNIFIDDIGLGDFSLKVQSPDLKQIDIGKIKATLPGKNKVTLSDIKVHLGKKIGIKADIDLEDNQLKSFLRDSGIADIPVWLNVSGHLNCNGGFEKTLEILCPGALTIRHLKIKNKSGGQTIVAVPKINIAGSMTITESEISYSAQGEIQKTKGQSSGVINFKEGFKINYESPNFDFEEVGAIADLDFKGLTTINGTTEGNSQTATFQMDMVAKNLEFESYFFGDLSTNLSYQTGTLFLNSIKGHLESTRYSGHLNVDLLNDEIKGDLSLPFFRMTDIQQAVIRKVDLKNEFLGSGSGRIQIDSPLSPERLGFLLEARLFKGKILGEEYNDAKIRAQSIEGIIIIQQARIEKEKTLFLMKGTIDQSLDSDLQFSVQSGFLQLSTILKDAQWPVAGEFSATGKITGKLSAPSIETKAEVDNLLFNKKKYGRALLQFSRSEKQTNLQLSMPESMEFVVVFPDNLSQNFFIDLNMSDFDIAPLIGFLISQDSTRNYTIETSGEISGNINTQDFWSSEFSSTVRNLLIDYKSQKIQTQQTTSIEMKNQQVFLNKVEMRGEKQYLKISQPLSEKRRANFSIDSQMNISFFKLFAPFIEKIDGTSNILLNLSIADMQTKIVGSSYTRNGFLKFPGFPHAFEDMSIDILFNEQKVLLNSISGTLAKGKVLGNGEVRFDSPGVFNLDINTDIKAAQLHFPEGFKTQGSASLNLSGARPPFSLSGDYRVTGGLIESNFDSGSGSSSSDLLEELLKKEVISPLVLDLNITTEQAVNVKNTLVEGAILGNIRVFDKINTPRISGEARFDKDSVVKVKDQEFEVTNSNFIFEGQTPINPKLSLSAKARVNRYDIDLILQGRATQPLLTMTSQPPLPQTQIISMLALGQLPEQFDQTTANQNQNQSSLDNNTNNGFEVGTSMIGDNPLLREIKEQSGFDVQISSSFDDQTGAAAPRVTLRNKISKRLEVSASSTTGGSNQYEGRVTYDLNSDLSTIFRVTSPNNPNNTNSFNINNTATDQNNPFGIDLEYNVEFD